MTMASGVDTAATGELDDHVGEKKVPAKGQSLSTRRVVVNVQERLF